MGAMEYRTVPRGGERVSAIGLGMGSIHASTDDEIARTVERALDAGVNFFDLCPSEFRPFRAYGRAFAGRRNDAIVQMHFGAVYETGPERKYGWTTPTASRAPSRRKWRCSASDTPTSAWCTALTRSATSTRS